MANNLIDDGGFSSAQQNGPVCLSAPFDGVVTQYVLEQEWIQYNSEFVPLPLNTPHPTYPAYLLVKESPLKPVGVLDVVKWTRTYATVPATRSEYAGTIYRFIGFVGYISVVAGTITNNIPGRKPFSRAVTSRIQYDYFLISPTGDYADAEDIPIILAQAYYMRIGTLTNPGGVLTWTPTYPLGSAADIAQGLPVDYITDTTGAYAPLDIVVPCVPTRTAYMALVTAGSEIVSEASIVSRWMGNIYVRATKYVVAQ